MMEINNLKVTSNEFDYIDEQSCHLELNGCLRLVHLKDTEFETIKELEAAVKALKFKSKNK